VALATGIHPGTCIERKEIQDLSLGFAQVEGYLYRNTEHGQS
jgi:hypothetical protein